MIGFILCQSPTPDGKVIGFILCQSPYGKVIGFILCQSPYGKGIESLSDFKFSNAV